MVYTTPFPPTINEKQEWEQIGEDCNCMFKKQAPE